MHHFCIGQIFQEKNRYLGHVKRVDFKNDNINFRMHFHTQPKLTYQTDLNSEFVFYFFQI